MTQEYQLKKLKEITGHDFKFVSDKDNKFGVKYYQLNNENIQENEDIFNKLSEKGLFCTYGDDQAKSILVFENEFARDRYFAILYRGDKYKDEFKPLGQINGHNVYLEALPGTDLGDPIVERNARAIVVVNVNNRRIPYYVSSGTAGKDKEGIASKRWYPLVGIGKNWLNKMPDMNNNPYPELDEIAGMLEKRFPAAKMRDAALANDIEFFKEVYPDQELKKTEFSLVSVGDEILDVANADFPEGVLNNSDSYSIDERRLYSRNKNIYLSRIINEWRAKPSNFLNVTDGVLMDSDIQKIDDLQKKLSFPVIVDNDVVWFETNKHHSSIRNIEFELHSLGINYNQHITSDIGNVKRLGIYKTDLINSLNRVKETNQNKVQSFNSAKDNIEQETKNWFQKLGLKIRGKNS